MTATGTAPKSTSYAYGGAYQEAQVEKHRERKTNHWQPRIALAHRLTDTYVLPRLGSRAPADVRVLDVGCSIGTMAIEMAQRGFSAVGVDFDAAALEIARRLAAEDGVQVEWVLGDVAEWQPTTRFDVAICFDIFEHLHDDELGGLLQGIRRRLRPEGALVFYTFPLQFDYLFFSRALLRLPLVPFALLPGSWFSRLARAYASVLDAGLLLATGQSYKERIKQISHCNPTTPGRLQDILRRAGFSIAFMETANVYAFEPHVLRLFGHQPIAHRNLYGVAYPR